MLAVIESLAMAQWHGIELDVPPTGTPMTYMLEGKQYIVMAYGSANESGLLALTLE